MLHVFNITMRCRPKVKTRECRFHERKKFQQRMRCVLQARRHHVVLFFFFFWWLAFWFSDICLIFKKNKEFKPWQHHIGVFQKRPDIAFWKHSLLDQEIFCVEVFQPLMHIIFQDIMIADIISSIFSCRKVVLKCLGGVIIGVQKFHPCGCLVFFFFLGQHAEFFVGRAVLKFWRESFFLWNNHQIAWKS